MMKNIAVFCGSSKGEHAIYEESTIALAEEMSSASLDLVYGGGSIGLMGILADQLMARGRNVYGVIPKKIYDWEVGHEQITQLEVVEDMHVRKAKMAEMAHAFIALPGGIGTLEEIIEVFTWLHLGYHHKPCALLNTNGFYQPLITFLDHMVTEGFLKAEQKNALIIENDPKVLLERLQAVII